MQGHTGAHLLRSVLANLASVTGGRILLALLRFVVALVIVQRAGLETFGDFALILSLILVAEWLSDFGLADIAVREMAIKPRTSRATLSAFAVCKAVQALLACGALWAAVVLLGYDDQFVRAGLIAGGAVLFYAGVQVYRVRFRAAMQMGRDVAAELLSAVAFLAAVWYVSGPSTTLEVLTLCYVVSRALNLVASAALARGFPAIGRGTEFWPQLRILAAAGVPLGLTGLMVSLYDAMDAVALSQWSTSGEVGVFTVAMRVLMFAVVVEQALATVVFPVLAFQWERDRVAFVRTFQSVVDWGLVAGGALFCVLNVGALGLASMAGKDPQAIAHVLQLLSWAILARVVVTLVGPLLIISGKLPYAVWVPIVVVAAKWIALTQLAAHGATGAAIAYLIVEIGVGLLPSVLLSQRLSGVWLNWSVPGRILAAAIIVAASAALLDIERTLLAGVLAAFAYLALAAAFGAVRAAPLRQLYASILQRRAGDG